LLLAMKWLAVMIMLIAALIAPAAAGDYSLANRPELVFPGGKGGIVHVSPYPMGKRAASVWISDACWRDCEGQCAWSNETCLLGQRLGNEACRPKLDACSRACQRTCRARGGPLLGFIDW
jgi:hypothetical protein